MSTPSTLEQTLARALPAEPAPTCLAGLTDYAFATGPTEAITIAREADDE